MRITARRANRRLVVASICAALAAAGGVAGCASSSGAGGGPDPASLVPARATLYAEAVIRPDAAQAGGAEAALARILRTGDVPGTLSRLFDRAAQKHGVTFAKDIEPWLGDRAAVAALSVGGPQTDAVLVAASSDDEKANAALQKILPGAEQRTYRDVAYRVDAREHAAGAVFGSSLVLGTEEGLKAAVDASKGSSLADSDGLKKGRETVAQDRVGFLYLDVAGLVRGALSSAGGAAAQAAPFLDPVTKALPSTVAVGLQAQADLLRLDGAAFGNGGGPQPAGSGADALAKLPADAWLGVGIGDLGQTVNGFLDRVSSGGGIAAIAVDALLRQAGQSAGLDIRRDLLAWMGDAGIFAAGASGDHMGGALVVTSKDPAATRSAVRRLATLARSTGAGSVDPLNAAGVDEGFIVRGKGDSPDILVAAGGDRFVVAAGREALQDALSPAGSLTDSPAFRDVAGKLGSGVRPSFFVDVEKLRALGAAKPGAGDHGRTLEAFGAVAGGTTRDGDITRARAVATLR
ncbi:MAG: hypothetical protein QOJ21_113 [Solirubrobacteraceae bacterium]|nr:hypothetical protein [Solirubrobacteraceae bacterium]